MKILSGRLLMGLLGAALGAWSASRKTPATIALAWPGSGAAYRIEYLESIATAADLAIRRGFLARLGDLMLGPSSHPRGLLRPFSIAVDEKGRLILVDPGAGVAHLFDPARNQHKFLEGPSKQRLQSPIGADLDAAGNIYVADSLRGKIYVFGRNGRFERFIGDARGEGIFKRPTGIAIDRGSHRIFLTDTLRHKIYVLNASGEVEREWGRRGEGPGEFNFPIAVAVADDRVFVLDSMNFRVQVFTREGIFLTCFGTPVNAPGGFFRPKSLAVDSQNKLLYVVDALFEVVQAFSLDGKLVLAFGHGGTAPGEFRLPAGIAVAGDGRILVADSQNRRIQVFRAIAADTPGGTR